MSVAFTREEDSESVAAHLPDRPVSPHPNLVTASGLAALDEALAQARAAYTAAQAAGAVSADRTALARATRDLRYYGARRASARLTEPDRAVDVAQFGCEVAVRRGDGRRQTFRIVGEDEAEPSRGRMSYVSPLARAILGKAPGDDARLGAEAIKVLSVET